jgi:hypothetical protein
MASRRFGKGSFFDPSSIAFRPVAETSDVVNYPDVVTQYERGEEPRGLYLPAETVLLFSEMGGAFDNDVYSGN